MTSKKTSSTKKVGDEVQQSPPLATVGRQYTDEEMTALLDRVRTEVRAEFRAAAESAVTPPKVAIEVESGVERDGKTYTVRKYADGHERWDRTDFDADFARTMLRGKGRGLS